MANNLAFVFVSLVATIWQPSVARRIGIARRVALAGSSKQAGLHKHPTYTVADTIEDGEEHLQEGICSCSDSTVLDNSFVQFETLRECGFNCYEACYHWEPPADYEFNLKRPSCLAKNGDEWYWRDVSIVPLHDLYGLGRTKAAASPPEAFKTWRGLAGTYRGDYDPSSEGKNLPGTCVCFNAYLRPFLDFTHKFRSVEMCVSTCQEFCQGLNNNEVPRLQALQLPTAVRDEDSSRAAMCVSEESPEWHSWEVPHMKTECRCYREGQFDEKGNTTVLHRKIGRTSFYPSVDECKPKKCTEGADGVYKLPSTDPYKCFRGSCAGYCQGVFAEHSTSPIKGGNGVAAECMDSEGVNHVTHTTQDNVGRFSSRSSSRSE